MERYILVEYIINSNNIVNINILLYKNNNKFMIFFKIYL